MKTAVLFLTWIVIPSLPFAQELSNFSDNNPYSYNGSDGRLNARGLFESRDDLKNDGEFSYLLASAESDPDAERKRLSRTRLALYAYPISLEAAGNQRSVKVDYHAVIRRYFDNLAKQNGQSSEKLLPDQKTREIGRFIEQESRLLGLPVGRVAEIAVSAEIPARQIRSAETVVNPPGLKPNSTSAIPILRDLKILHESWKVAVPAPVPIPVDDRASDKLSSNDGWKTQFINEWLTDGVWVGMEQRPDRNKMKLYPLGTPLDQISPTMAATPDRRLFSSLAIIFVNGVDTPVEHQFRTMQLLSEAYGIQVIGLHNGTMGLYLDIAQCIIDKAGDLLQKWTKSSYRLDLDLASISLGDAVFSEATKSRPMFIVAHSQGAIITSRALYRAISLLRNRYGISFKEASARLTTIHVITFGGAAMHYPDGPEYIHFINERDFVPELLGLGWSQYFPSFTNPGKGAAIKMFNNNDGARHRVDPVYLRKFSHPVDIFPTAEVPISMRSR